MLKKRIPARCPAGFRSTNTFTVMHAARHDCKSGARHKCLSVPAYFPLLLRLNSLIKEPMPSGNTLHLKLLRKVWSKTVVFWSTFFAKRLFGSDFHRIICFDLFFCFLTFDKTYSNSSGKYAGMDVPLSWTALLFQSCRTTCMIEKVLVGRNPAGQRAGIRFFNMI